MGLSNLTKEAVESSLAEFDEIGREAFLEKYGFEKARAYFIERDGKRYDSKAIAGAAHGYARADLGPLQPVQFKGGGATVKPVMEKLGFFVVNTNPRNPNWSREELILALEFYKRHRARLPDKDSPEVVSLSEEISAAGKMLGLSGSETFRNVNGVSMKLMNFRRLDPEYTKSGKVGLSRGAKGDKNVWKEFQEEPALLSAAAEAIRRALAGEPVRADSNLEGNDEEAAEVPSDSNQIVIFAKRMWGFDPERWPLIAFGDESNRNNLIRKSNAGDQVVIVGTKTKETAPEEQGRLLGIAEFGRIPIDSSEFVDEEEYHSDRYGKDGKFRWPKAVPMTRAWSFSSKPLLLDVLSGQLPQNARTQAVRLSDADSAAIMALEKEEITLPNTPALREARNFTENLARRKGKSTGPLPSSGEYSVTRRPKGTAYTYVLRFGRRDIWKIGYSSDPKKRFTDINTHIPFEVLDEQWLPELTQQWPSEAVADEKEQALLRILDEYRTEGERVMCSLSEINRAWVAVLKEETEAL